MYDLACPIIDHIDGITHALRANEYYARHEQYQWFLERLGMPKIEIFDFRYVPASFRYGHETAYCNRS
jgi:glutamyl-tRNA synthetase